jgi:hypothetical protein
MSDHHCCRPLLWNPPHLLRGLNDEMRGQGWNDVVVGWGWNDAVVGWGWIDAAEGWGWNDAAAGWGWNDPVKRGVWDGVVVMRQGCRDVIASVSEMEPAAIVLGNLGQVFPYADHPLFPPAHPHFCRGFSLGPCSFP